MSDAVEIFDEPRPTPVTTASTTAGTDPFPNETTDESTASAQYPGQTTDATEASTGVRVVRVVAAFGNVLGQYTAGGYQTRRRLSASQRRH